MNLITLESNKIKKIINVVTGFIICIFLSTAVFANSGIQYCNKFWSYLEGSFLSGTYVGNIQFIPAHVIESVEGFYLEEGRQVKQAYIICSRIHRFSGEIIHDSGRQYSLAAANRSDKNIYSTSSRIESTWHTEKINYGWIYF